MIALKRAYITARNESSNAWNVTKSYSDKAWDHIREASLVAWRKVVGWATVCYDFFVAMSLTTKVFISLSIYMVLFLCWQFMTYNVSQPVFVMVNLSLVILNSAFTCYVIFKSKSYFQQMKDEIASLEAVRKEKDQDIRALKSEIHDLNMASRKQQSFGKNSQVLIDTVRKNRASALPSDPRGQFILKSLAQCADICSGVVYMKCEDSDDFELSGEYALTASDLDESNQGKIINQDDAILGQVIKSGQLMKLADIPTDSLTIMSGLGESHQMNIYILPLKYNNQVVALAEVSSFTKLAIADIWKDIDNVLLND